MHAYYMYMTLFTQFGMVFRNSIMARAIHMYEEHKWWL